MKILVIGAGGREHALAWKLAQSERVSEVLVAPGNAGTATERKCRNVGVSATDIDALVELVRREDVAVTVVGPEAPLVAGVVDRFRREGLRIFGPSAAAAQLEGSKAFAKAFLARHGIPTAHYAVHSDVEQALAYVREKGAPIVIKADGLAAGKGVVVAMTLEEAEAAVTDMLSGNAFGEAGSRVVVEEFLTGEEASFISMVDGRTALPATASSGRPPPPRSSKAARPSPRISSPATAFRPRTTRCTPTSRPHSPTCATRARPSWSRLTAWPRARA